MALNDNALTTLQTVKDELGITDTSSDPYLIRKINVYSKKFENYCRRKFKKEEVVEKHEGNDSLYLLLDRYPVESVSKLVIGENEADLTHLEIFDDEGKIFYGRTTGWNYKGCGFPKRALTQGLSNGDTVEVFTDIEVTYIGGYVLPDDETNRDLPYGIEDACIQEVVYDYNNKGTNTQLKSWTLKEATKSYFIRERDKNTGLFPETLSTLKMYQKPVM
jgi:hypothetical protein